MATTFKSISVPQVKFDPFTGEIAYGQRPIGRPRDRISASEIKSFLKASGSNSGERWITINSDNEGGGTHVKINGDGKIVAGPAGLAARGITHLSDFGKKDGGDKKEGEKGTEKKPSKGESAKQPHEMTKEEYRRSVNGKYATENDVPQSDMEEFYGPGSRDEEHHDAVIAAMRDGKRIPDRVLDESPKLQHIAMHDYGDAHADFIPKEHRNQKPQIKPVAQRLQPHRQTAAEFVADRKVQRGGGILVGDELESTQREHKRIVQDALTKGDFVPKKVLADYPDLAKPTNQPTATQAGGGKEQLNSPAKPMFTAKDGDVIDEHGVRHASASPAKAKEIAERWNRDGKPADETPEERDNRLSAYFDKVAPANQESPKDSLDNPPNTASIISGSSSEPDKGAKQGEGGRKVEMAKLSGSEKQVQWADGIRNQFVTGVRPDGQTLHSVIRKENAAVLPYIEDVLASESSAKWIIDNKSSLADALIAKKFGLSEKSAQWLSKQIAKVKTNDEYDGGPMKFNRFGLTAAGSELTLVEDAMKQINATWIES